MKEIKRDLLNQTLNQDYEYSFEIPETGLYLIEIIASGKNWWQNTKSFSSFFKDDNLAVKLDDKAFPKLNGRKGLFDGEAAWNGNNLKGLFKTIVLVAHLNQGEHKLSFLVDKNPTIKSINIFKADNNQEINYIPTDNNPAQDGDRRQWITLVLVDLALKDLSIKASAKSYLGEIDSDDIKLKINGEIQPNESELKYRYWYWVGKSLNGESKEFIKSFNSEKKTYYIELIADKSPILIANPANYEKWEETYEIAVQVMEGIIPDPTNGSNSYYDDSIWKRSASEIPDWIKSGQVLLKIERLNFLKVK